MTDFRRIAEGFWASPQIEPADLDRARELGVALVINNRPDGEAPAEPQGEEIARAARDVGIGYCAIPVTHAGFSRDQVEAMVRALKDAPGPVLAYCRSGTRSTLLWALAQARLGRDPEVIAREAAAGGYDVGPIRSVMEALSRNSQG